jgi:hypothetical protein
MMRAKSMWREETVSRHQNAHRQTTLDSHKQDQRSIEASEQQSVEEFIAKLLRAVRKIEGKNKAS